MYMTLGRAKRARYRLVHPTIRPPHGITSLSTRVENSDIPWCSNYLKALSRQAFPLDGLSGTIAVTSHPAALLTFSLRRYLHLHTSRCFKEHDPCTTPSALSSGSRVVEVMTGGQDAERG